MILSWRYIRRLRAHQRQILTGLLLVFLIDALRVLSSRPATARAPIPTQGQARAAPNTTVFIVSVHRNTEDTLREGWNDAVLHLAQALGRHNVHFSAIEGGSQDKTKEALMELKGRLDAAGISNDIALGQTVWEQMDELETRPDPKKEREKGWIWNEEDRHYDMRRIPYLSAVRNEAMRPLRELREQGRTFDKVFWVNDVIFDTEDFLNLLHTRQGHYAAACSMDFKVYPKYYDTFALRDDRGLKTASYYWPWFVSPTSRASAQRGEPVRVASCWNGMVLFDAAPFYAEPPLQFRGIDDSLADLHLEASECCLIHTDNPLSADRDKGVWLNPNVRVGYNVAAYKQVKGGRFPGVVAAVFGAWANRWSRFKGSFQYTLEHWTVQNRLSKWRSETPPGELSRTEVGDICLINEMQIMWQNGWKHL